MIRLTSDTITFFIKSIENSYIEQGQIVKTGSHIFAFVVFQKRAVLQDSSFSICYVYTSKHKNSSFREYSVI